jgi:signal transduction histidine kinase
MDKQVAFADTRVVPTRDQIVDELQESNYRHRQMVQNLAAAIYTCDANGYIKFYNKAAVELWGREPEIGKDLWCGSWKIFEPDGVTPLPLDSCPMAVALKEGRPVRGKEIIVERPDGRRINVMPHPDPILDSSGCVVEAVNMLVDITDLKKKENALLVSEERYKQIAEELEKRVQERTADLRQANLALQQSNEELEQFAFVASHDMQEPLRKIKHLAHRLEGNTGVVLNDVAKSYLSKIKASSDRMTHLIKGILEFSRIDQHKQFEETDLNKILQSTMDDLELRIEEKKAHIESAQLPVVQALPLLMTQLFHNIISNSLKFCEANRPCKISIRTGTLSTTDVAKHDLDITRSWCELVFIDNGIGFGDEYKESIFQIFERLNTREAYDGAGIGLALCRKIVVMHQGKIFAESKSDEGTAIHVILPV